MDSFLTTYFRDLPSADINAAFRYFAFATATGTQSDFQRRERLLCLVIPQAAVPCEVAYDIGSRFLPLVTEEQRLLAATLEAEPASHNVACEAISNSARLGALVLDPGAASSATADVAAENSRDAFRKKRGGGQDIHETSSSSSMGTDPVPPLLPPLRPGEIAADDGLDFLAGPGDISVSDFYNVDPRTGEPMMEYAVIGSGFDGVTPSGQRRASQGSDSFAPPPLLPPDFHGRGIDTARWAVTRDPRCVLMHDCVRIENDASAAVAALCGADVHGEPLLAVALFIHGDEDQCSQINPDGPPPMPVGSGAPANALRMVLGGGVSEPMSARTHRTESTVPDTSSVSRFCWVQQPGRGPLGRSMQYSPGASPAQSPGMRPQDLSGRASPPMMSARDSAGTGTISERATSFVSLNGGIINTPSGQPVVPGRIGPNGPASAPPQRYHNDHSAYQPQGQQELFRLVRVFPLAKIPDSVFTKSHNAEYVGVDGRKQPRFYDATCQVTEADLTVLPQGSASEASTPTAQRTQGVSLTAPPKADEATHCPHTASVAESPAQENSTGTNLSIGDSLFGSRKPSDEKGSVSASISVSQSLGDASAGNVRTPKANLQSDPLSLPTPLKLMHSPETKDLQQGVDAHSALGLVLGHSLAVTQRGGSSQTEISTADAMIPAVTPHPPTTLFPWSVAKINFAQINSAKTLQFPDISVSRSRVRMMFGRCLKMESFLPLACRQDNQLGVYLLLASHVVTSPADFICAVFDAFNMNRLQTFQILLECNTDVVVDPDEMDEITCRFARQGRDHFLPDLEERGLDLDRYHAAVAARHKPKEDSECCCAVQ